MHDLLVWEEPEYVLLETSGVTDPEALLATLREEPLRGLCFLDSVVTVVDAAHFRAAFARSRSMVGQVRAADVVLLNKVDLAAEAQRDATIRAVQDIQPGARILPCVRACVSLPLIMLRSFLELYLEHHCLQSFRGGILAFSEIPWRHVGVGW